MNTSYEESLIKKKNQNLPFALRFRPEKHNFHTVQNKDEVAQITAILKVDTGGDMSWSIRLYH